MTLFISEIYVPLSGVRVFSGAGVDIFPSLPCVGKPPMVVVTVQGAPKTCTSVPEKKKRGFIIIMINK